MDNSFVDRMALALVVATCSSAFFGCDTGTVDRMPTNAADLFERAEILVGRGELETAIDVLTRVTELEPNNAQYWTERGIVHERMGRDDAALADYGRAVQADSEFVRAWNNRAAMHARAGRFDEAIADLKEAVRIDPDDLLARQNLSLAFFDVRDLDASLEQLDEADRIDPLSSINVYRRGLVEHAAGRLIPALSALDKAILLATRADASPEDLELIETERQHVLDKLGRGDESTLPRTAEHDNVRESVDDDAPAEIESDFSIVDAVASLLQAGGLKVSDSEPPAGFDFVVNDDSATHPVLVVSAVSPKEFLLNSEQLLVLRENPDSWIAVHDPVKGSVETLTMDDLDRAEMRPQRFIVRPLDPEEAAIKSLKSAQIQ